MKSNTCCQIWVNFFRNNQPVCYPELGRTHRHSFWFEPIRELVSRSKTIWSYHIYHIWSWNLHPNPKKSRIISWWHLFHGTIFWHISTAWSQLWLLQCLNHLRQNAASQTGWVTGWVLVSFPNWSSWGFWLYNIWHHVVIINLPQQSITGQNLAFLESTPSGMSFRIQLRHIIEISFLHWKVRWPQTEKCWERFCFFLAVTRPSRGL